MGAPHTPGDNPPGRFGTAIGRAVFIGVQLAIAWLLWSGLYKPLLLALGALSCLLTLWLLRRMGYFEQDATSFRYSFGLLAFWGWLVKEVVQSSLQVTRVVLARKVQVHPRTVALDVEGFDPVDQVLLGNSITLTPGTLTLDVYQNRLLVHALTAQGAKDVLEGKMQEKISALRGAN